MLFHSLRILQFFFFFVSFIGAMCWVWFILYNLTLHNICKNWCTKTFQYKFEFLCSEYLIRILNCLRRNVEKLTDILWSVIYLVCILCMNFVKSVVSFSFFLFTSNALKHQVFTFRLLIIWNEIASWVIWIQNEQF